MVRAYILGKVADYLLTGFRSKHVRYSCSILCILILIMPLLENVNPLDDYCWLLVRRSRNYCYPPSSHNILKNVCSITIQTVF